MSEGRSCSLPFSSRLVSSRLVSSRLVSSLLVFSLLLSLSFFSSLHPGTDTGAAMGKYVGLCRHVASSVPPQWEEGAGGRSYRRRRTRLRHGGKDGGECYECGAWCRQWRCRQWQRRRGGARGDGCCCGCARREERVRRCVGAARDGRRDTATTGGYYISGGLGMHSVAEHCARVAGEAPPR